jgi:hypothetical protein
MAGRNVKSLIPGTGRLFRHLGLQKVSFEGPEEFSDMGECEKDLWVAGRITRHQQQDCHSLVMEFSSGKLKQKAFFYSVAFSPRPNLGTSPLPHTQASVYPPFGSWGGPLACGRGVGGGGSQF